MATALNLISVEEFEKHYQGQRGVGIHDREVFRNLSSPSLRKSGERLLLPLQPLRKPAQNSITPHSI